MGAIHNMLCLSTVHVKPETMRALEENRYNWLPSYRKINPFNTEESYGTFVLVGDMDPQSEEDTADIPEDLQIVLNYADAFGCTWIMFDADEDEIGELPMYRDEWDRAVFAR